MSKSYTVGDFVNDVNQRFEWWLDAFEGTEDEIRAAESLRDYLVKSAGLTLE